MGEYQARLKMIIRFAYFLEKSRFTDDVNLPGHKGLEGFTMQTINVFKLLMTDFDLAVKTYKLHKNKSEASYRTCFGIR